MSKAINKPDARDDPADNPYEDLYGKPITKEEAAIMHFNLVNFVETLIAMDRQKQAWDKNKKDQPKQEA
jgi:hypothetical protein